MVEIERVPTGIPGLDELIEGGFVKGSSVMVSGGAGTGKTIFALQFLLEGLEQGEKGMYISLEENPGDIKRDIQRFGWNLEKHMDNDDLLIEYIDPLKGTEMAKVLERQLMDTLESKIEKHDVKRAVLDSTSIFGLYFPLEDMRKHLFRIIKLFKKAGATSVLTAERPENSTRYHVESYVADASVHLHYLGVGASAFRNIEVPKIRATNQEKGSFPFEIFDGEGIRVFADEEELAEAID